MAAVKILGFKIMNSRAENDMNAFFDRYEKILAAQKEKTLDEITEWGAKLVADIQKYVNKQKQSLEKDYAAQIQHLNKTYREFVGELHVHEQSNNTKQINQLLERCNALKFKLVTIEYHGQNIPFQHLTRKDEEDVTMVGSGSGESLNDVPRINITLENGYETLYNTDTEINSSSNTSFTHINQTQTTLPSMNSKTDFNRSTSSNNSETFHDTKEDDLLDKCPVCFMIFPPTMVARDRSQHIHEHYTDD